MKNIYKSLLLLAVFIGSALQVNAYEYFTIIFKDGTKSDAFYATDVDSIRYSKFDLDGIEYPNWQVQEIWTVDSVYRYPLTSIASLDFTDVDVNKVAADIASISAEIAPIYALCNSTEEISQNLSTILNISGVENAWIDNQSLFVKIRDWGIMSYSYPPEDDEEDDEDNNIVTSAKQITYSLTSNHTSDYKACIINQMANDQRRTRPANAASTIQQKFSQMGIKSTTNNKPFPTFFQNEIFDYDLVFLMTHGHYDGHNHWLFTGEELICSGDAKTVKTKDFQKLDSIALNLLNKKYPKHSADQLSVGWVKEKRNGVIVLVGYTMISEHYIAAAKEERNYNNMDAVIFNLSCQSLKGNYELGKTFLRKGAKGYLGYTDTNSIGAEGGEWFFNNLLNGKCAYGASQKIPAKWCSQKRKDGTNPQLLLLSKKNDAYNYHITDVITLPAEQQDNVGMKLKAQYRILDPYSEGSKGNRYGFIYSESPDPNINNGKIVGGNLNYDTQSHNVESEYIIKDCELLPNTTYYYRAYMHDGYCGYYGEIKTFLLKESEAYVVNYNDKLTFYYDTKKDERGGRVYVIEQKYTSSNIPQWVVNCKSANFDSSFAHYLPQSTAYWFYRCKDLREINNLCYLNTSKVTNMQSMFYDCRSLTSLDLSNFETSNVTNMRTMFGYCQSLTSLDLSSFNTSNVTDMGLMFYLCSRLTSLDLSSFKTSNVTDMSFMFYTCYKLTSLDMSNFDTSNVTDMSYMFGSCGKLKCLDLSSFNTSNVTNMSFMFHECDSLTSLNLSSFDTSNVTNMGNMFSDCESLTSLDLSNFNTSNVTGMSCMFDGCSSLTSLDLSSFDTSNVTSMGWMFYGCNSLKTIYAGNWNLQHLTDGDGLFRYLFNLTGGRGTKIGDNVYGYDKSGNPLYYNCPYDERAAHIDEGKDNPGLFTAK